MHTGSASVTLFSFYRPPIPCVCCSSKIGTRGTSDGFEDTCKLLAENRSLTPDKPTSDEKQETASGLRKKLRHRFQNQKSLNSVELIETLFDAISYELPALKFNYFSMHSTCWTLLQQLKIHLEEDLRELLGQGWLERENQLPFIVGYILSVAVKSQAVAVETIIPDEVSSSKMLFAAAEMLDSFLESGVGSLETVKLLQEEQQNMRLEDIEFRAEGQHCGELESGEEEDEEEAGFGSMLEAGFGSMLEAMAALRTSKK